MAKARWTIGRISIGVSGVGDRHAEAAPMTVDVPRRLAAELIDTAMLLAAGVGSGIIADWLSGNDATALPANTIATASYS
jgi:aminoglycoside phosphotransferase